MPLLTPRPWLRLYAEGVPADVPFPTEPVHTALETAARLYPDRPALDFMGRKTSYAELWEQVLVAARALAGRGVRRGSVVAIALPNCPQHVVAFNAVLRLGAIVVEHNPTYGAAQFAEQLADCGATCVIAWDKVAPVIAGQFDRSRVDLISVDMTAALPLAKRLALRLPLAKARRLRGEMTAGRSGGAARWEKLTSGRRRLDPSTPAPRPADVAMIQYTGGTTGTPKGAILTHANLVANATQSVVWMPSLAPGEEVFYGVLPFFHVFGLTLNLLAPVRVGGLVALLPKFDVKLFLETQRRLPGTFLAGVPPMFDRLANASEEASAGGGVDLTSFRHAISGAMALPARVAQRWEAATGGMLVEGYGLTESSPIALGNPVSAARRPGALGVPFPSTQMRIADLDDPSRDAAAGAAGELWVRGPQVFQGYLNRPEETAACLTRDGWLRTGDVVQADEDGLVRLVDRIKEVIITGGFNVYPSQ
ncbi:MAG: AMP-binding protein, partial [Bifidobacteriaceae bacterium]|nr:AMP-binding protein [Bifidobacteriaceae bacterium]